MEPVKVIPCLDMMNGRIVKGVHFRNMVDAGDPAGTVDVIVDGKTVASIPVVTMEAVAGRGIRPALQRFWQNWAMDF